MPDSFDFSLKIVLELALCFSRFKKNLVPFSPSSTHFCPALILAPSDSASSIISNSNFSFSNRVKRSLLSGDDINSCSINLISSVILNFFSFFSAAKAQPNDFPKAFKDDLIYSHLRTGSKPVS